MGELVGFGSPGVTALWALSLVVCLAWLGRQLLRQRLVTIPTVVVGWFFLAPLLLQYPFTFSPVNALATGADAFAVYPAYIDEVFIVSLLGILSWVAGFALPRRVPGTFVPAHFMSAGVRIWAHGTFLYISTLFNIALFVAMFFLGMVGAEGARYHAQLTPALRPIYNTAHTLLPLTTAVALTVGWQRRRWIVLALAIANISLGVLTGTRAAALGGILLFFYATLCHRSLTTGLSARMAMRTIVLAAVLLVVAVYLGDVREGRYNPVLSVLGIGARLFYGNNFSDLRDFAWVRSYWDGDLLWGRTELAGMLAFIPSFISPFRSEWGWGVVSIRWTGLDSTISPGLRPGLFGELYFNFGVPGVILGGMFFGYVCRRLHAVTVRAAMLPDRHAATLEVLACYLAVFLAASFLHTPGFFGVYVTVITLAALQVVALAVRSGRGVTMVGVHARADA